MLGRRYAIYYTPPPFSGLAGFGAAILGYDCFAGTDVPHMPIEGLDAALLKLMTVDPRRYGFHATIVAPFTLERISEPELGEVLADFACTHAPVPCGPLAVAPMGHFIVLAPPREPTGIAKLAEDCLKAFDNCRQPLSAADRERRMLGGLTQRQIALMDRWGYPYVLDEFRFHMTLAGPVPDEQIGSVTASLSRAYAVLPPHTPEIDALSLMRQDDRHQRFKVISRYRLRGRV